MIIFRIACTITAIILWTIGNEFSDKENVARHEFWTAAFSLLAITTLVDLI